MGIQDAGEKLEISMNITLITILAAFTAFGLGTWLSSKMRITIPIRYVTDKGLRLGAAVLEAFVIPLVLGGSAGILTATFLPRFL